MAKVPLGIPDGWKPSAPQPADAAAAAAGRTLPSTERKSITVTAQAPDAPKSKPPAPPKKAEENNPAAELPPKSDQIPQPAGHRRPKGMLRINGKLVTCLSWKVDTKAHFSAGTWSAELEPHQQPEGYGDKWWADVGAGGTETTPDVTVEMLIGFLDDTQDIGEIPSEWTSLLTGQVDDVDISPNEGKLSISGRDLTARLIDQKTSDKWPNLTASQIVTSVAESVGLSANVTATKRPAGQYYHQEYNDLTRDIPYWDLLTFLADQEGFDIYVTGKTVYFGPPKPDNDRTPWTIFCMRDEHGRVWSNAKTLRMHRSLTIAKDISVTVMSHNYETGKAIKAIATRAGTKAAGTSAGRNAGKSQNYVIRRPGLTHDQAQKQAFEFLARLSLQERTFEATLEGDPRLDVHERKGKLTGFGNSFDGEFYFDHISHTFSLTDGYVINASCKNHPTGSTPGDIG